MYTHVDFGSRTFSGTRTYDATPLTPVSKLSPAREVPPSLSTNTSCMTQPGQERRALDEQRGLFDQPLARLERAHSYDDRRQYNERMPPPYEHQDNCNRMERSLSDNTGLSIDTRPHQDDRSIVKASPPAAARCGFPLLSIST